MTHQKTPSYGENTSPHYPNRKRFHVESIKDYRYEQKEHRSNLIALWGMFSIFGIIILGILVWATMMLWPYDSIVVGEYGPIITDEYTEDGLPVVREGAVLSYEVEVCSDGSPVRTERWADLYGPFDGADGEEIIAFDGVTPTSSRLSETLEFPERDDSGCATNVARVELPEELREGSVYAIRNITSYRPNPVRIVENENSTEPFLLLAPGEKIP